MDNRILVVGAGISGLTLARVLAEAGCKVTVLEKRKTIGGNLYDYVEDGIRIQTYGPHIFHTEYEEVFNFLSRFTEWEPYEHRVLGLIDGKYVPVPFNLTSLEQLFERDRAEFLKEALINEVGLNKKVPILTLMKHPDGRVREFARFVYDKVFAYYTFKQWGMKPEELGEAVGRVPVYVSYEDRYFTDKFQFQPKDGYTALAENLADHPNVRVQLGVDALEKLSVEGDCLYYCGKPFEGKVVFTGRIDELLNERYGALPYRSLDFVFETHDTPSYQPSAVVNYTTTEQFTRISEFTKFCCKPADKTVIVKEYSKACGAGDVPYYPIPKDECRAMYDRYLADAQKIRNLYLLGRLANYRYINTDVAVKNALALAEQIKAEIK